MVTSNARQLAGSWGRSRFTETAATVVATTRTMTRRRTTRSCTRHPRRSPWGRPLIRSSVYSSIDPRMPAYNHLATRPRTRGGIHSGGESRPRGPWPSAPHLEERGMESGSTSPVPLDGDAACGGARWRPATSARAPCAGIPCSRGADDASRTAGTRRGRSVRRWSRTRRGCRPRAPGLLGHNIRNARARWGGEAAASPRPQGLRCGGSITGSSIDGGTPASSPFIADS